MGKGCAVPIKWGKGYAGGHQMGQRLCRWASNGAKMGMMGTLCFAHPTLRQHYE